jgi:hypothetical protein
MFCGMTNGAAIGYALMAADAMGLTDEQKRRIEKKMYDLMDFVDEGKAEKRYQES